MTGGPYSLPLITALDEVQINTNSGGSSWLALSSQAQLCFQPQLYPMLELITLDLVW